MNSSHDINTDIDSPLTFACGTQMKNRFALAPMTNTQSHSDGTLSEDEFNWLKKRAEGGFGMIMTCASHVQKIGQGFPGQLGIFGEEQVSGHKRLTKAIQKHGSLAVIQLHHAGMRSPAELIGQKPVCPSENEKHGVRMLRMAEIVQLRDDFITAAIRAKKCGYDGVEVHGAHGYILCQFLSSEINHRTDEFGGSLENRARLTLEILRGIRNACGDNFLLGLRLSPERFGMKLEEIKELSTAISESGLVDFLDISLWDYNKPPEGYLNSNKRLLEHFTELDYGNTKLTVAGKIRNGSDVRKVLDSGVDFATIGRSAILHYDFPNRVMQDSKFETIKPPVSESYLKEQALGPNFVEYMKRWPDFVE